MSSILVFDVVMLCVVWGAQLWWYMTSQKIPLLHNSARARFGKILLFVWWLSVIVTMWFVVATVIQQYRAWEGSSLGKYLLPPYQGIGYFFSYAGSRHAANTLVALASAILIGALARVSSIKFGDKFLEDEEGRLFALGILLSGYPGFLLYIVGMLVSGVALTAVYAMLKKGRAPLYFLWMPVAIFAIPMVNFFIPPSFLALFFF